MGGAGGACGCGSLREVDRLKPALRFANRSRFCFNSIGISGFRLHEVSGKASVDVVFAAGRLDTFQFLCISEQLAREAGFVASQLLDGILVGQPGTGLRGHAFGGIVMGCVGGIFEQAEVQDVGFKRSGAVDARVAVDDLLE